MVLVTYIALSSSLSYCLLSACSRPPISCLNVLRKHTTQEAKLTQIRHSLSSLFSLNWNLKTHLIGTGTQPQTHFTQCYKQSAYHQMVCFGKWVGHCDGVFFLSFGLCFSGSDSLSIDDQAGDVTHSCDTGHSDVLAEVERGKRETRRREEFYT